MYLPSCHSKPVWYSVEHKRWCFEICFHLFVCTMKVNGVWNNIGVFLDFKITYFCVSQKSGYMLHEGNDNRMFIFRWTSLWKELYFSLSSFRIASLESNVPCCKHKLFRTNISKVTETVSCTALSRLPCVGRWLKLDIFGINLYMRQLC